MGGIRGNYCSTCFRHLMHCDCAEYASAAHQQGAPVAAPSSPVADDGLPPLPKPIMGLWSEGIRKAWVDQVRQVQREAYEAGRAAGMPDGWQLMPVEPTEEMHVAAVRALHRSTGNDDFPRAVLAAFVATAPQPPRGKS